LGSFNEEIDELNFFALTEEWKNEIRGRARWAVEIHIHRKEPASEMDCKDKLLYLWRYKHTMIPSTSCLAHFEHDIE
jgi:hypothetical protein